MGKNSINIINAFINAQLIVIWKFFNAMLTKLKSSYRSFNHYSVEYLSLSSVVNICPRRSFFKLGDKWYHSVLDMTDGAFL